MLALISPFPFEMADYTRVLFKHGPENISGGGLAVADFAGDPTRFFFEAPIAKFGSSSGSPALADPFASPAAPFALGDMHQVGVRAVPARPRHWLERRRRDRSRWRGHEFVLICVREPPQPRCSFRKRHASDGQNSDT